MTLSKKLFSLAKTSIGDLIVGIAFGKFSKFLPVKRIMETDTVIAFWHPKPFWEQHILIVPKKGIKNLTSLKETDIHYLNEVFQVANKIIKDLGWEKDDYSLICNGGSRQKVNQLHFHLAKGTQLVS